MTTGTDEDYEDIQGQLLMSKGQDDDDDQEEEEENDNKDGRRQGLL